MHEICCHLHQTVFCSLAYSYASLLPALSFISTDQAVASAGVSPEVVTTDSELSQVSRAQEGRRESAGQHVVLQIQPLQHHQGFSQMVI